MAHLTDPALNGHNKGHAPHDRMISKSRFTKWLTYLRNCPIRQCQGSALIFEPSPDNKHRVVGSCCAVGVGFMSMELKNLDTMKHEERRETFLLWLVGGEKHLFQYDATNVYDIAISLNDTERLPFKDIADILERIVICQLA